MEVKEISANYSKHSPILSPKQRPIECGELPTDWASISISDMAAKRSNAIVGGPFGSDLVSIDYVLSGVPVVRGQNMGGHYVSGEFVFVSNLKAKKLKANLARSNDIVFTQRGTLGQVAIVPSGLFDEYVISQSQMKLTLNADVANTEYVYQYFISAEGQKQVVESAIQTGVPHTNLTILRSYRVPLPPTIAEQVAIAEALSDADALIESLEQLIAKKRQIKQGTMQALLTAKLRLPGFKDEWHASHLGNLATFYKGNGLPKSALDPFAPVPCIHYGELFTQYRETIREVISHTVQFPHAFYSTAQDVLMPTSDVTPTGLAKASCLTIKNVILGGDILVIRPDTAHLHGSFMSYVIRYSKQQVLQLVTGSTVFHLYASDMKKFVFAMPSITEQEEIVRVLDDIDTELTELETRLTKTRHLKQGMMQELLTGRIRLV